MTTILCIAGRRKSGKTTLSKSISEKKGWRRLSFGDYIRTEAEKDFNYKSLSEIEKELRLQELGNDLIMKFGYEKFCHKFLEFNKWNKTENLVIEGVRHKQILIKLMKFSLKVFMIYIQVDDEEIRRRIKGSDEDFQRYIRTEQHPTESQVVTALQLYADKVLDGRGNKDFLVEEVINWLEQRELAEEIHREEVCLAINQARFTGLTSFEDILRFIGGADPFLVEELIDTETKYSGNQLKIPSIEKIKKSQDRARRLSAGLLNDFPRANPRASQWWFSLETIVFLSEQIWKLAGGNSVAFLGAPTVGFHYAVGYNKNVIIFDGDRHVIDVLNNKFPHDLELTKLAQNYNAFNTLPEVEKNKYNVVLIDPPWYPPITKIFLQRATELIKKPGYILCTLPSKYTRPDLINQRTELIKDLLARNYEIISLDAKSIKYRVPDFEWKVYQGIKAFMGRMWRTGDLLSIKVLEHSSLTIAEQTPKDIQIFARDPKKRRFFLDPNNICDHDGEKCEEIKDFNSAISTRQFSRDEITIWGTNKEAMCFFDENIGRIILDEWEKNRTLDETVTALLNYLKENKMEKIDVREIVTKFNEILHLWKGDFKEKYIKTAFQREKEDMDKLSKFAMKKKMKVREHKFVPDKNRTDFQRDRDRILWSHSFRHLSNKTQLFPTGSDEQLRRRLAHSIEVMQLALTIANSFGLNADLTAAGALAHDIGHAPFGHAGDAAIDKTLKQISGWIGGFNHYEHGVDVVRYLDDMYLSSGIGPHSGLNLTMETMECIFKHTFFRTREDGDLSQEELSDITKHDFLRDNTSCHLEGQAVRIADKISYLVSDIEDGVRMGVIKLENLLECKFFERSPIDIIPRSGESLFERIISQRRAIINILMEDLLNVTDGNLSGITDLKDIRNKKDNYIVSFSSEINREIHEIWVKLQTGILHKDKLVVTENANATKIISNLLLLYIAKPEFIDIRFLQSHRKLIGTDYMNYFKEKIGARVEIPNSLLERFDYKIENSLKSKNRLLVSIERVISAVDYTASLTDIQAKEEYQKYWRLFD